jgi:hypothetical protein
MFEQGSSLRLRKMSKFLKTKGHPELAVLEYSEDTPAARDCTADLALLVQAQLRDVKGLYNFLGCNFLDCNFATWCRTMRPMDSSMVAAIHPVKSKMKHP